MTAWMAGVMLLAAAAGMPRGATAAAPRALTPDGQGALVFIGDSLTVGADAFGALATNLRRPRTWTAVVLDAKVGRTASQGASTLASRMTRTRDVTAVVIALGTNDMISQRAASYPPAVIEKVMHESLGVPVLWVTPTFSASIRPDWRQRALRFNRALRAAQQEWPNLYVADWAGKFVPKGASRFIADGVHLTVSGYKTRASWTVRQVSSFGRTIIDATTTSSTTSSTTTTTTTIPATTTPPATPPSTTTTPTTSSTTSSTTAPGP
jgi:lysophospholipase L1-like esterase